MWPFSEKKIARDFKEDYKHSGIAYFQSGDNRYEISHGMGEQPNLTMTRVIHRHSDAPIMHPRYCIVTDEEKIIIAFSKSINIGFRVEWGVK